MTKDDDILIRIGGKTYRLRDEAESLRKIPWSQRKRLIEILEAMKQAEYVVVKDQPPPEARTTTAIKPVATLKPKPTRPPRPTEQQPPQDTDAMMQRFLAEQKNYKSSIPTKASVYKWFLIIFAVIFLLVLML